MAWTIACFCGTVFSEPRMTCPTCGSPVPRHLVRSLPRDGVTRPQRIRTTR